MESSRRHGSTMTEFKHDQWAACSPNPKRNSLVFITQLLATYLIVLIIVIVSLYNLTFLEKNREFWIVLVSSMTGIIMPSPMSAKGNKLIYPGNPPPTHTPDELDGLSSSSRETRPHTTRI